MPDLLHPDTVAITAGRPHTPGGPLSTPVVLAAPFRAIGDENPYQRETSTHTVRAFEDAIGALEGGTALAFASGMAAISAVVESLPVGTVAVVPAQAYGGTVALFDDLARLGRLTLRPVDLTDTASVVEQIEGADLVWLETVTNPMIGIPDLPTIIAAARDASATVAIDSTFSTPLNLRPLELGADIVMHSATKAISGHSDLQIGVLVSDDETIARLRHRRTLSGAIPGAFESYLALRGLRTLPLRWERAQQNALVLAERLDRHAQVTRVRFPGLASDPGHAIAARDHAGFGAVLSFEVRGDAQAADRICEAAEIIVHATSLGGVETIMERRTRHGNDVRTGVPDNLIRLSVGIEHVEDLWADLEQALQQLDS